MEKERLEEIKSVDTILTSLNALLLALNETPCFTRENEEVGMIEKDVSNLFAKTILRVDCVSTKKRFIRFLQEEKKHFEDKFKEL